MTVHPEPRQYVAICNRNDHQRGAGSNPGQYEYRTEPCIKQSNSTTTRSMAWQIFTLS